MSDSAEAADSAVRKAPRSKTDLFVSFTWLALQGFGGVLAVVQRELVDKKQWLTLDEFVEDWSVAQILPGPNVVNLSLMIGGRTFGLPGALAALAGLLLAPTVLVLLLGVGRHASRARHVAWHGRCLCGFDCCRGHQAHGCFAKQPDGPLELLERGRPHLHHYCLAALAFGLGAAEFGATGQHLGLALPGPR